RGEQPAAPGLPAVHHLFGALYRRCRPAPRHRRLSQARARLCGGSRRGTGRLRPVQARMSSLVSSAGLHSPNAAAARSAGDRRLDRMATAIVIAVTLAFAGAMFAAIGLTLPFLDQRNYWTMTLLPPRPPIVRK